MNKAFRKTHIALAVAAIASVGVMGAVANKASAVKGAGSYVAGDFHNHTTCSDGSISMQKLVNKSTETPWGLDWFVQAGHGGSGNRNCTLAEDASLETPAYPLVTSGTATVIGPATTWQNSVPPVQPKGLVSGTAPSQNMWRWQSIQEFQYPLLEYLSVQKDTPLFIGVESVVAGHEHSSMSVITGQMPLGIDAVQLPLNAGYVPLGNANALAQWEYCFDRADSDTSRGNTAVGGTVGNNWDCTVAGSPTSTDPATGWNDAAKKIIPASGAGNGNRGHLKTVEALKWMAQKHPENSYYVPAHLERAGPFNPDGNNGFNIEHLRNFNNAAPGIAFGFETQPGHGASDARGEYTVRRNNIAGTNVDSVGGTTYGGTGVYGAQVGGVWDALLGEGRGWWFFASSDWHNRGIFGPDDRRSTQDFYPGEYQRTYVMARNLDSGTDLEGSRGKGKKARLTPRTIVDGLRSGNAWSASGQLIDRLAFVACAVYPSGVSNQNANTLAETAAYNAALNGTDVDTLACATMGEKLVVRPGADIVVAVVVRDPAGRSNSPYTFANPSLAQIGMTQPLDMPVLDHVDVIRGMVYGYRTPGAADYAGAWPSNWIDSQVMDNVPAAAKNTTAAVVKTFNASTWTAVSGNAEFKRMSFRIPGVTKSQYVRLRGTNLPPSVPFETDANGNPLADRFTNAASVNATVPNGTDGQPANANLRIPCKVTGTTEFNGCPAHLGAAGGQKFVSFDVAAWADLWFYSNPIFIEVQGNTLVAGVSVR